MAMKPGGRCLVLIFLLKCVLTVAMGTKMTNDSRRYNFAQLKEVGAQSLIIELNKPKIPNFTGYFIQVHKVDGLKSTSTKEMYLSANEKTAHVGNLNPLTTYRISVWTRVNNRKTDEISFDAATLELKTPSSDSVRTTVTSSWNVFLSILVSIRVAQFVIRHID